MSPPLRTRPALGSALRLVLVLAVAPTLASGCASTRHASCPAPIGDIVRDDCDAFRVQYETLGVTVGANVLGVAGASAGFQKTATQAPTELIQVMAHQAAALCADYNACRLTTPDYLARRAALDQKYAAAAGIAAELRGPGLSEADRGRLLDRLLTALGAGPGGPTPSRPGAPATPGPIESKSAPKSYPPRRWLESRMSPPRPPPVRPGFPLLLHSDEPITLQHLVPDWNRPTGAGSGRPVATGLRSASPPGAAFGLAPARDGYQPKLHAELYGAVDPDDVLIVDFAGLEVRCPTKKDTGGRPDYVAITCAGPKEAPQIGAGGRAVVRYQRGATGETAELGGFHYRVVQRRGDEGTREGVHVYGVDLDPLLDTGWILMRPEPYALPADVEVPYLQVFLRLRKHVRATMRCAVGGEVVTEAIPNTGYGGGGQVASYQDKPRYERLQLTPKDLARKDELRLSPSTVRSLERGQNVNLSRGVEGGPHVEWWRYAFPLPWWVEAARPLPEGRARLGSTRGEHVCTVSVDGQPVREARFTVGADGRFVAGPEQSGAPGSLSDERWRIPVRRLANEVETTWEGGR
jgi:hypothetical protein